MSKREMWMDAIEGATLLSVTRPNANDDVTRFVFDRGVLTHSFSPGTYYSEWTQDSAYSEWTWEPRP